MIRSNNYVILPDSKSALEALKHRHYKSPTIILHRLQILRRVRNNVGKIILISVSGYVDISPSERANSLARNGPYVVSAYSGVSIDDLKKVLKDQFQCSFQRWRDSCKYAVDSPYIAPNI